MALAERDGGSCDAGSRIPTGRWPLYATSFDRNVAAGETEAEFEFEAERDTTFTDMSVSAELEDGTTVAATISVEYCNVKYLESSNIRTWQYCCQRKPIFLVGVRENKKLKLTVRLGEANAETVVLTLSLSGFQGNGCCG